MDKLKIAILSNGYGTTFRGSERYTSELYKLLENDYVINIFSADLMGTKLRHQFKVPRRNNKAYMESYYFCKKLYKDNALDGFDLIINNSGFVGSYWCNKIRKKNGVPYICLERGGGAEEKINNWFKPDRIVYLTQFSFNKSHYKKKAHLPVGINIAEYQKKRKIHPFMKDLERPIFLSTSALVRFKRIPLLIDAVASLEKGTLLQTSDGAQKQEICEYGLKTLGDRFQYAGKVEREVLLSMYQHSDCFVSASEHESFGIVYLEALASGLPIITQYDERRKEIIGDAGYLVDCSDKNCFPLYFRHYNKDRLNLLEQAKKFDWKVLKSRYIELIEEVSG